MSAAVAATTRAATIAIDNRLGIARKLMSVYARGAGVAAITAARMSFAVRPSSIASGASAMRWRSAGRATRFTSSGVA